MLVPDTTFGRYNIRSALGAGGMGQVFLAEDTELERLVALKVLSFDFAGDEDRARRFVQEAKAASALNHPNILTIYEIGQVNGVRFTATEFIKGETLRERMRREPLALRETLDVALQIAAALNAAHMAGIVHRDIKPENVMLREDGLVKVLDFGLAKLVEVEPVTFDAEAETRVRHSTLPGIILGTTAYMSPEQVRGRMVDARSDIWSLGVCLYEIIQGRLPFTGETTSDKIAAILKSDAPPFAENVVPEMQQIVHKALQKDASKRYQTIKDTLLDLKHLQHELEFSAKLERSKVRLSAQAANVRAITNSKATRTATLSTANPTQNAFAPQSATAGHLLKTFSKRGFAVFGVLAMMLLVALGISGYSVFFNSRRTAISSVAVLPFVNGSNNAELEYLSDGLSESLIDRLSQLPQLKVIARSSSFKYKGQESNAPEVARALGVEAIVTGRIVQRGDLLTVRAELVDAGSDKQLWGESYNRRASDLQKLQEEIALTVSEKLRLRLSGTQEEQLTRRETKNPAAYEMLLKARFYYNKSRQENYQKAVEYYQQAIALDSEYALAHAELSRSYSTLVNVSAVDQKDFLPRAEAAARKAIELDENLAEAHAALAVAKTNTWDWEEAEREANRAIALNPNSAGAYTSYAYLLSFTARHAAAIAAARRAREIDPLSPAVNNSLGLIFYLARQYDEAIATYNNVIELNPDYALAYANLSSAYLAKGMHREAIAAYQRAMQLSEASGSDASAGVYLSLIYARAGERQKAEETFNRARTSENYVSPGRLAMLYAAFDNREQAFEALERAYVERDFALRYIAVAPEFDSLRSDPRFASLVQRVGLTQ